jgi:hypothetical protein
LSWRSFSLRGHYAEIEAFIGFGQVGQESAIRGEYWTELLCGSGCEADRFQRAADLLANHGEIGVAQGPRVDEAAAIVRDRVGICKGGGASEALEMTYHVAPVLHQPTTRLEGPPKKVFVSEIIEGVP